eukprot:TRINITY_DN790_c0_g1_i2.p1 TRINITY_DN790_c0_g1~~TRINITY_DN790_c0_g1_i2.p1  ORF type:complete len:343 (-),score=83.43 TRINITY_DN790_c0_g1_i2:33-1061(-)
MENFQFGYFEDGCRNETEERILRVDKVVPNLLSDDVIVGEEQHVSSTFDESSKSQKQQHSENLLLNSFESFMSNSIQDNQNSMEKEPSFDSFDQKYGFTPGANDDIFYGDHEYSSSSNNGWIEKKEEPEQEKREYFESEIKLEFAELKVEKKEFWEFDVKEETTRPEVTKTIVKTKKKTSTNEAPNKNVLKNHEKNSYSLVKFKKYAKSTVNVKVIPMIASKCGVTVKSFQAVLEQLNFLKTPNFHTLPNIWMSNELKIVQEDYSDKFNSSVFEGIDMERMGKAVQMFKRLYFKRYCPNRAYNGRTRDSMAAMIATSQNLHKCLDTKANFGLHKSLLSEDSY